MSESYTPTGATAAAITRFTAAEAATGTFGAMHRTWQTEIADRTRFLLTTGLLAFPATQVTSADANTLDDYEEGTWTITMVCGSSGTITLDGTANTGKYTKVGRQVAVSGRAVVASVSSPVGSLSIAGLPFTIASGNSSYAAAAVYATLLTAGATTAIAGYGVVAGTTIILEKFAAGSGSVLAGNVQATSDIIFSLTYFV